MEKEISEIMADVKALIEITKLSRHEQDKKNEALFGFMNESTKILGQIQADMANNKAYTESVSKALKRHSDDHWKGLTAGIAGASLIWGAFLKMIKMGGIQ